MASTSDLRSRATAVARGPSPTPDEAPTPERWIEGSLFRYLASGGVLFIVDYLVYIVLAKLLGLDVRIAQGASRTSGAVVGFFLHKLYSFRAGEAGQSLSTASQGAAYTLVTLANLVASPFLVHLAVGALGGMILVGKVLVDVVLVAETYVLLRIVFRPAPPRA